jgi:hypothetical protein
VLSLSIDSSQQTRRLFVPAEAAPDHQHRGLERAVQLLSSSCWIKVKPSSPVTCQGVIEQETPRRLCTGEGVMASVTERQACRSPWT